MLHIRIAKSAGFCFGVRRAIEIALKAAGGDAPVYILGNIVHNEYVVDQIRQAGVQIVDNFEDIPPGSTLLLRAHGTPPEIFGKASARDLKVVDATCPMVLEIHRIARKLEEEGYEIVIIGDQNHDEVRGIAAQVRRARVVSRPDEVRPGSRRFERVGVVVQSTQNIENIQAIIACLVACCREMRFINTVCKPTTLHQDEIRRMPQENDAMIVVGSFSSANTRRLAELSAVGNPATYHVQSATDLQGRWLDNVSSIGVTAGASTPDILIQQVIDRILHFRPDSVVETPFRPANGIPPEMAERSSPGGG